MAEQGNTDPYPLINPTHPTQTADTRLLDKAWSELQSKITEPENNCTNTHQGYKYPDLAACWAVVRPLLEPLGLSIRQFTVPHPTDPFIIRMVTKITHSSGQWESFTMDCRPQEKIPLLDNGKPIIVNNKPLKVDDDTHNPNDIGKLLKFMRRWGLCSVCGIESSTELVPKDEGGGGNNYHKRGGGNPPSNGSNREGQIAGIKKALEIAGLSEKRFTELLQLHEVQNVDQLKDSQFSGFSKGILHAKKLDEKEKVLAGQAASN